VADVDLYDRALVGFTDLTVSTNQENLKEIKLHCHSQISVSAVAIVNNGDNSVDSSQVSVKVIKPPPRESKTFINVPDNQLNIAERERTLSNLAAAQKAEAALLDAGSLVITFSEAFIKDTPRIIRIFFEVVEPQAGLYFYESNNTPCTNSPFFAISTNTL
jgi:hypothetical protein